MNQLLLDEINYRLERVLDTIEAAAVLGLLAFLLWCVRETLVLAERDEYQVKMQQARDAATDGAGLWITDGRQVSP